jgi:hypothetical protein
LFSRRIGGVVVVEDSLGECFHKKKDPTRKIFHFSIATMVRSPLLDDYF